MPSLLIRNATVATMNRPNRPEAGDVLSPLGILRHGTVAVKRGLISYVGPADQAPSVTSRTRVVDAEERALLPGLVDPHTHLVFGGSRVDEFAQRMAGVDYRILASQGGGIAATVRATRAASDEELFAGARNRILAMRAHGVTGVEIKSGYGLSVFDELRCLRVARRLGREGLARVSTTFLGAHAVPEEYQQNRSAYVRLVIEEMLPAVAAEHLADACDVYCDDGAFSLDETRVVFEAASAHGLRCRVHAGQFEDLGAPELVAALGGCSADHLESVSVAGLQAMATSGVVAVLLPGAWTTLMQVPPPVASMRTAGVAMAIGTDCNPGTSPTTDLPLCAALAVRTAGLSLEEAVLGITRVAAQAVGWDSGRIRVGDCADLALYPWSDPRTLAYSMGGVRAAMTLLGGQVVHEGEASDAALW